MRQILIKKANGVMEPFETEKIRHSLLRSGATADQTDRVVTEIVKKIIPGDTTGSIYRNAFELLKTLEKGVAARYSLRRSLAELGPSGFPFEIFIARIFTHLGYRSQVGLHIKGKCIDHEVDLIAESDDKFIMGEVKFHNNYELKNDSKTIMYVHSRYEDLKRSNFGGLNLKKLDSEGWLITNTKFTETTINYAGCYGMKLLGWNFPYDHEHNLQSLIEKNGLEPVTVLTTLTTPQKQELLRQKIVMCDGLANNLKVLPSLGVDHKQLTEIKQELTELCHC